MTPVVAMPIHRRGQKMAFHLDEDDLTLAWDTVRKARLPAGTRVRPEGIALPAWFWTGTGLEPAADASLVLRPLPTIFGPSVCIHAGPEPDIEAEARRIHSTAPTLPEAQWQKVRLARDGPDTEADFPLGAFVIQSRHDEVTAARMRLPSGTVETWTTIGAGAAPTEFVRLQEAVGAYHVALVAVAGGGRTVGLWTEAEAPQAGQAAHPALRRLYRTQGSWRYGVKFSPLTAA